MSCTGRIKSCSPPSCPESGLRNRRIFPLWLHYRHEVILYNIPTHAAGVSVAANYFISFVTPLISANTGVFSGSAPSGTSEGAPPDYRLTCSLPPCRPSCLKQPVQHRNLWADLYLTGQAALPQQNKSLRIRALRMNKARMINIDDCLSLHFIESSNRFWAMARQRPGINMRS